MSDLIRLLPFQPDPVWLLCALLTLAALLWNIGVATHAVRARHLVPTLGGLGTLCSLLVVPALLIGIASSTLLLGRAVAGVGWLWPLTLTLFCVHSAIAAARRNVPGLLVAPMLAANLALCLAAWSRFLTLWIADVPSFVMGIHSAHASLLSYALGTPVLGSALALQVPLLVPMLRPKRRLPALAYTAAVLISAVTAAGIAAGYPQGVRAAATFSQFDGSLIASRPADDFAVGLMLLPTLSQAPDQGMLQRDLAVADSMNARIVSITLLPSATSLGALEALADDLAAARRDSIRLVVTLSYDPGERQLYNSSPEQWSVLRLKSLDRIVRTLRPDVLVPAEDPLGKGARLLGITDQSTWHTLQHDAAEQTRRVRPRTQLGVAVSFTSPGDSLWYQWASTTPDNNIVGLLFAPGPSGGASLNAQLGVASRWMTSAPPARVHWVLQATGYPVDFGELNQQHALWGTIAWATRQSRVQAVVVDGAGDYDRLTGLRRSDGSLRVAIAKLSTIRMSLDGARPAQP